MAYNLHSKFDINQHKKTYINYLEVIVRPDGTVEYAVPSHQEKLTQIIMDETKMTKKQVWKRIPIFEDALEQLCSMSGCVSVWDDYIAVPDHITKAQINKLKQLKMNGLYRGTIPQAT